VDIWGFITIYYPIIELLSDNYKNLTKQEMKIFNQIQFIMVEYLYAPRHEPINMIRLISDLKILGNLLNIKLTGKKKTPSSTTSSSKTRKHISHSLAAGIHKKSRKNDILFKRKTKKQTGKKLFFLSIK
jgi:hypothetical protein